MTFELSSPHEQFELGNLQTKNRSTRALPSWSVRGQGLSTMWIFNIITNPLLRQDPTPSWIQCWKDLGVNRHRAPIDCQILGETFSYSFNLLSQSTLPERPIRGPVVEAVGHFPRQPVTRSFYILPENLTSLPPLVVPSFLTPLFLCNHVGGPAICRAVRPSLLWGPRHRCGFHQ